MVDIIGTWLPRQSETESSNLYYTSLLVLWKPWHVAADLKHPEEGWQEAFKTFRTMWPEMEHIASNMQYHYECKDSADKEHEVQEGEGRLRNAEHEDLEENSKTESVSREHSGAQEGEQGSEEDL